MKKSPEELYQERTQRVQDAIELREPDRVPFTPFVAFFPAAYAGLTYEEAMTDFDKSEMAIEKVILEYQPDLFPDAFRVLSWGPTLGALDYKQLVWPGHGLGPNVTYQFVEGEYMTAEEYDDFVLDPTGFMLKTLFPRIYGTLESFKNIPPVPTAYYTRMVPFAATFGTPEVQEAVGTLLKAGEYALEAMRRGAALNEKMSKLGFPPGFGSSVYAPFDYIGDFFRGTKGIMLDMFRCPDKLLEAIDKVYRLLIKPALAFPKLPGVHMVFIPLHKGLDGFMSLEHFKTFFWPSLKQVMLDLIDAGFTPCPLWEGKCDSRLETIADMPKGKAVYWFEQTDIFKAKEILGDTICLRGNIPASLLNVGTPDQVMEYCKKLIQVAGKGGGLLIDGAIGIPDEAKPENVKAIVDAIEKYGVYG